MPKRRHFPDEIERKYKTPPQLEGSDKQRHIAEIIADEWSDVDYLKDIVQKHDLPSSTVSRVREFYFGPTDDDMTFHEIEQKYDDYDTYHELKQAGDLDGDSDSVETEIPLDDFEQQLLEIGFKKGYQKRAEEEHNTDTHAEN